MDNDTRALLRAVAGIRLVLVHSLSRLDRADLSAISESINREMKAIDDAGGLATESAFSPYRDAVDSIISSAVRLSDRRG